MKKRIRAAFARLCLLFDAMPPGWAHQESRYWGKELYFSAFATVSWSSTDKCWNLWQHGSILMSADNCDDLVVRAFSEGK